jgi:hypothetical protein
MARARATREIAFQTTGALGRSSHGTPQWRPCRPALIVTQNRLDVQLLKRKWVFAQENT